MTNRLGHTLLRGILQPGRRHYLRCTNALEATQRSQLRRLLGQVSGVTGHRQHSVSSGWSWEQFAERQPVTEFADWRTLIEAQRAGRTPLLTSSPVMRYQPTSGSTSAIKWIPYTQQFLRELDAAIGPWLGDLYKRYPGVRGGAHYWSLSWVPTSMRQAVRGHINDDMKLLSGGKRWLASRTQAVPDAVSLAATSDDSLYATLAYLASRRDLTTISVWSPTFALGLLEKLGLWRQELIETLSTGSWGARQESLQHLRAPTSQGGAAILRHWNGVPQADFFRVLWPQLALISAWDTAGATRWAQRLHSWLPQAAFQGKGLWATEGVVTIPQGDQHVLAATSHVYEFEDATSGEILPPWKLDRGQEVVPLISTGSGLLRYKMSDRLVVDDFYGQLPCLRFLGRNDGSDMVGEKISTILAQQTLDALAWPAGVGPVTILAADQGGAAGHPAYVVMADAPEGKSPSQYTQWAAEIAAQLEEALQAHFHYKLARNLGQLDPARCLCVPHAQKVYLDACSARGMIEGNIKIEALRSWSGDLPGATPVGRDAAAEAVL